MIIHCPIWLLVTIVWIIVSALLAHSAEKETGYFGGVVQAMGCITITACYVVFMVTYFLMR